MAKINILVAIDDPDWSSILVHTLFNVINKENSRIILLNVIETTPTEKEYFYKNPEKFISHEAKKAKFAYIENFLETNNFDYSFIFEEGDAADHIVNTAKNLKIDLVVVGSHNKKIFERLFLGSVAYKVLRLSPCSVLIVSSKYHIHNVRKKEFNVLLAVNGSESSLDAARKLGEIIDTERAKVYVLNARIPAYDIIPPEAQIYVDMEKLNEESAHVSQEMLDKAAKILEEKGITSIEKLSLCGKPAPVILDYAERNSIDLIVMGSLGKKDVATLLLGSTSAKVTERSEVPVLVIKSI